jgi:hypothetical protein
MKTEDDKIIDRTPNALIAGEAIRDVILAPTTKPEMHATNISAPAMPAGLIDFLFRFLNFAT